jgi:hypothetical protein
MESGAVCFDVLSSDTRMNAIANMTFSQPMSEEVAACLAAGVEFIDYETVISGDRAIVTMRTKHPVGFVRNEKGKIVQVVVMASVKPPGQALI